MTWRRNSFDWNQARAFLVTAEEGSLSAAARALGSSQPTVGRQVSLLEENLGVLLFDRIDKGMKLTESGVELLNYVQQMGDAAQNFSLIASGKNTNLDGLVTITASEVYSYFILPKIIDKFHQIEPKIQIEIIASNSVQDLKKREADIAIRSCRPQQPDLIAKKIADEKAYLYATHSFSEKIGNPQSPEELGQAEFVGFEHSETFVSQLNALGVPITEENFKVSASNQIIYWELVCQGLGLGVITSHIGDLEPRVKRVMPEIEVKFPMWIVSHKELKNSLRMRRVFDFLTEELKALTK